MSLKYESPSEPSGPRFIDHMARPPHAHSAGKLNEPALSAFSSRESRRESRIERSRDPRCIDHLARPPQAHSSRANSYPWCPFPPRRARPGPGPHTMARPRQIVQRRESSLETRRESRRWRAERESSRDSLTRGSRLPYKRSSESRRERGSSVLEFLSLLLLVQEFLSPPTLLLSLELFSRNRRERNSSVPLAVDSAPLVAVKFAPPATSRPAEGANLTPKPPSPNPTRQSHLRNDSSRRVTACEMRDPG